MRVPSRLLWLAARVLALVLTLASCELTGKLNGLQGGCPPTRGATQIKVPAAGGDFCIDGTETTNDQYAPFVDTGSVPYPGDVPEGCEGVTSPTPMADWPANPGYENFPVVQVNWCQAYAYCRWAGKRLCGAIGGGPVDSKDFTNPAVSQWQDACSAGGAQAFPYGDTYDPAACSVDRVSLVASYPACVGSLPGIYDLSGNVWEWTDTCASSSPTAFCDAFGGAFDSAATEFTCVSERNWTRTSGAADIGFRCCLDLEPTQ